MPDPPRLLVEQCWQRKLLGKHLVDEDAERSEDVCLGISIMFTSKVQPFAREIRHIVSPVILGAH